MVYRIYVQKRPGFDVKARGLAQELHDIVGVESLTGVRMVNRYDVEGIDRELFDQCKDTVFSEPQVDTCSERMPDVGNDSVFATEFLPGQFDQRASSAAECIQLISQGTRPIVRSATLYYLEGNLSSTDIDTIKRYVINPVESREATLAPKKTLRTQHADPKPVATLDGFIGLDTDGLQDFRLHYSLAMDLDDLAFIQDYFAKTEKRDPTITEIRMIDTYWSDHCRHTTFNTAITDVRIDNPQVQQAYDRYMRIRHELGRDEKPVTLMDLATIGGRYLEHTGQLKNQDKSDEVNACTVKCTVDVDGHDEDWLFLFKNETHNHPTEIEPFGGAATCIGGAIRDPLSGRSYVYQGMRISGTANPLEPVSETLLGKLPQRKLEIDSANGYSSYGNQIGLATGQVSEIYHPGYKAKHMELGAVVGATPADHVVRETPVPGDVIVLVGGRTGRDGIGGATGSSKAHDTESLAEDGAEVQRGNAPEERKLQRLFRRGDAASMIKRCNDFGAGGVSVACGELADGLEVDLDKVPLKYQGLDGTEIAISESQERMAVVLAVQDVDAFCDIAKQENLEATPIARVTEEKRLKMTWRDQTVVDVSRDFLNTDGAPKKAKASVGHGGDFTHAWRGDTFKHRFENMVADLNVCSKKGLSERFDSTIGAATVLMPFGGKRQLTPSLAMVAKLPVDGKTATCSGMAWGGDPYLTSSNQYEGGYAAVVDSVSKLVASGFSIGDVYLTMQEYFEKLGSDATRWGKPFATLLGALMAQVDLGVGAIGGKDSMSGSFENLDVPPTIISFAVALGKTKDVVSPEFKHAGDLVFYLRANTQSGRLPDPESYKAVAHAVESLIKDGYVRSASIPQVGGLAQTLFEDCVGNRLGIVCDERFTDDLFSKAYGAFALEIAPDDADAVRSRIGKAAVEGGFSACILGRVTDDYSISYRGQTIDCRDLQRRWESTLDSVMPYRGRGDAVPAITFDGTTKMHGSLKTARPRVVVPVFPGTNTEFDVERAFRRAGAEVETLVFNNLSQTDVAESCERLCKAISESQIVMLPGGFSGGDEPDGSAKLITAFFRAPQVAEAVQDLLQNRDGLMLGICNGFQALVKLGLVPFGEIRTATPESPTLTFNSIGRHQSRLVRTRVCSVKSPWMSACKPGEVHLLAVSHGEGRFVAPSNVLAQMQQNGQIVSQYVDEQGHPSMDLDANPNGSVWAIEGITSSDGRVLGEMCHPERAGEGVFKNVPGNTHLPIFESGVRYFTD